MEALGPNPSSESSSSGISLSLPCRDILAGGEAFEAVELSSRVRFRFCKCGGSWGPIDAMVWSPCVSCGRKRDVYEGAVLL